MIFELTDVFIFSWRAELVLFEQLVEVRLRRKSNVICSVGYAGTFFQHMLRLADPHKIQIFGECAAADLPEQTAKVGFVDIQDICGIVHGDWSVKVFFHEFYHGQYFAYIHRVGQNSVGRDYVVAI